MRFGFLILLSALSSGGYALDDFDKQQIINRIKPVGSVRVQKDEQAQTATTQPVQTAAVEKKEPGQAVYDQYCSVCHRDGVAGAPKFRVEAEWKARLAARKDINGLTASAIKGINAMPAKGTCVDCSDEDIKNAIQYMLPQS